MSRAGKLRHSKTITTLTQLDMSGALLDSFKIFRWLSSTQRLSQGSLLLFSEERKRLGETLAGSGHVSVPL